MSKPESEVRRGTHEALADSRNEEVFDLYQRGILSSGRSQNLRI